MSKNLTKKLGAAAITLSLAFLLVSPIIASAANFNANNYGLNNTFNISIGTNSDLKGTIVQIINIILGFLGIIAVIIILAGGFKWMTAGGNEEKVGEARKMIVQGLIGLAVIFGAWAITAFVINQLATVTA
ncbi:MAG: hypothetical protein A3H70_04925 [Candidatus Komeilibacteria bacterium RIFCSPLOWO2_02_FULL_48_11]|uniref:DUF4134 domain-containing protein n=1 Tax=Candidatus Komeilibacteria bacterium RIFCSPLOWO2_02_FULL_48_11 TaxID=1798553 RepID=A0A1G2BTY5_9BACT|nr:MAG: hypothetical protein A3H70_04925 [Candidatus Komeilibacteria bacterium RIFCSPLOWO2_02_FULL_48_11]